MAVGRISGPLLKSNLVRNGIDLAFETDLLYLDVNNSRLGVKTSSPQYELDVNGTTRTTNIIAKHNCKALWLARFSRSTEVPRLTVRNTQRR